jgi:CelD/BcsL family acetyltransferase involved in cellulose biosynthesis
MKSDKGYTFSWRSFAEVKEDWKKMETPSMSPFLYYDYLAYVEHFTRCFSFYRPRVACMSDSNGCPLMLVPLKGSLNLGYYKMLGDIRGCDRMDALYKPELSTEERVAVTRAFYSAFKSKAKLHRLQEQSPMVSEAPAELLLSLQTNTYVSIAVDKDWNEHFGKLHRNVRQSMRTAYNRMKRDGKQFKLEIFDAARPIDRIMWKKIMKLYFERIFTHYKQKKIRSLFGRLYWHFNYFYIKHDTLSLHHLANSFHAVLMEGERPMAFLSGMMTHDGHTITVPRLAIDDNYRFYSPGYVLLAETLNYLGTNTGVHELDLSRGEEKYKFDLGGIPYKTTDIILSKSL